jgi:hypothetical protein
MDLALFFAMLIWLFLGLYFMLRKGTRMQAAAYHRWAEMSEAGEKVRATPIH